MDWNSPTTKKYIAEAEAQGFVLLGTGKSARNLTYLLPCGHEKEMQAGDVRRGRSLRCQKCLEDGYEKEAEAQGCELLGAECNAGKRTYRLPCGHERELEPGKMRAGDFGCRTCISIKLNTEAKAQKCVLIGEGDNNRSRMYQLECGHKQSIETHNIRTGQFKCQTCYNNELSIRAEAQGCVLLGKGRNKDYRNYRLPCGHEQETQPGAMLVGRCKRHPKPAVICRILKQPDFSHT
jgi:hypothetical protein